MMKNKNTFPSNFNNLIASRTIRNVADSFYMIALSIGLFMVYRIEASQLSLFTLVGMVPSLCAFFYAPLLNRIVKIKRTLVVVQIIQVVVMLLIISTLRWELPIEFMYSFNFLFQLVTSILNNLQMRLVPEVLELDEELIEKSVDVQYFATNTVDIISNAVSSLLLGLVSYMVVLQLSLPFFLLSLYFVCKLTTHRSQSYTQVISEEVLEEGTGLMVQVKQFISAPLSAFIIVIEALLSGGTDLLLVLTPLYIVSENLPLWTVGLVYGVRRGADLLGALLAPKVKLNHYLFFGLDYLISGSCLMLLFLIDQPWVKLLLFFIAFVMIGVSGNVFEKMIYEQYATTHLNAVYSVNMTLFSLFSILAMLVPFVYDNISVLGILVNCFTIIVGIVILVIMRYKKV